MRSFCKVLASKASISVLLGLAAVAAFPAIANAQACTLTASGATYAIPATSHYDTTQTSNLTGVGGTAATDYIFEDGWWFRVAGDTQEAFFPAPTTTTCAGSSGTITWADVNTRGLFSATNTLTLRSAAANSGQLTLTMSITNLSAVNPLTISVFHGADFDVNGTAAGDSATLVTPNNYIRITDSTAGTAEYKAFNSPVAYLVRPFATTTDVFGLLGDAAVTNFDNTGLPATNIDFTGAYQWNLTIPPSGTSAVTVQLTGNTPATAAGVDVSGRVVTGEGRGLTNAQVTLTDRNGVSRTVVTGRSGAFVFNEVEAGQTYILSIGARRYSFTPRAIEVNDNVSDLIFTPDAAGSSDRE
jgi:hypothetical protein